MRFLVYTLLSIIFTNCLSQKEKKVYNTKEIYISSLSPCGTINTGGILYSSKNIKYNKLVGNDITIIDEVLNTSDFKKVFPTKLPNKYYYARTVDNEGKLTTLILFEESVLIVDENSFISVKSKRYLEFFNNLNH